MGQIMLAIVPYILILFFTACNPSSLDDYKDLGKNKTHKLLVELQKIQNRDQLLDSEETLTQCFKEIYEVMIAAEKFQHIHCKNITSDFSFHDHELSDKLRFEMLRIYRFDGGKEILEKIRNNVLNKN